MKRGRTYKTKVSVAKRKKQFAAARPARVAAGYQAGREMAGHPNQELKAFDLASTAQQFTNAGNFTSVFQPVSGAEMYNRVGRKTYGKSLRLRGFVENIATATADYGRILVVYDSQPNAAAPAGIATLLQDSNAAAATTGLSEINLINRQRFKILRDIPIMLPPCTNAAGVLTNGPQLNDPLKGTFNIDEFIPLKGLETIFNATNGGTIADISSGSFLVAMVSQTNAAEYQFVYTVRTRYYD